VKLVGAASADSWPGAGTSCSAAAPAATRRSSGASAPRPERARPLRAPQFQRRLIMVNASATAPAVHTVPAAHSSALLARPIATLRLWLDVSRERRALRQLDTAALADIGMSREQACREAARPFWDVAPR